MEESCKLFSLFVGKHFGQWKTLTVQIRIWVHGDLTYENNFKNKDKIGCFGKDRIVEIITQYSVKLKNNAI